MFVWETHLWCDHLCITIPLWGQLVERLDLCVRSRCYVEKSWQQSKIYVSRAFSVDGGG